jgi:hypothetical protein
VEAYGRWRVYYARNKILLGAQDDSRPFSERSHIFILRTSGDDFHGLGFRFENFVFEHRIWALNNLYDHSGKPADSASFLQIFLESFLQISF